MDVNFRLARKTVTLVEDFLLFLLCQSRHRPLPSHISYLQPSLLNRLNNLNATAVLYPT